jgi:hypothetical protein
MKHLQLPPLATRGLCTLQGPNSSLTSQIPGWIAGKAEQQYQLSRTEDAFLVSFLGDQATHRQKETLDMQTYPTETQNPTLLPSYVHRQLWVEEQSRKWLREPLPLSALQTRK